MDVITYGALNRKILDIGQQFARKEVIGYTTDSIISDIRLVPFEILTNTKVSRLFGHVSVTQAGKLFEMGIYDSDLNLISSSEVREIPQVGNFEITIPEIELSKGIYYIALTTNATTAQFGINDTKPYLSYTLTLPLPTNIPTITLQSTGAPQCSIYGNELINPIGFEYNEMTGYRVLGSNGSQPWAWNTATGKFAVSVNSGSNFTDVMNLPSSILLDGGSPLDLLVYNNKIYLFLTNSKLLMSSDLTASATWSDISCPVEEGLRHSVAKARPYGIAILGTNLYQGEYSTASTGEFAPDGPRILRMDLNTNTWTLSKEFSGARHIHSFYAQGSTALYVSLGDAGYGSDIGIQRLVPSGVGTGPNGTDSWVKWTSVEPPYTNHYPVDFILQAGVNGIPDGLYCTSDRPGKHVLYSKITGVAGSFNLSAQLFKPSENPNTETVRSIIVDSQKNIYYWSAETTKQALYVSPIPYTTSYKLKEFPITPMLMLTRAVLSNEYIMMYNQRFKVPKIIKPN